MAGVKAMKQSMLDEFEIKGYWWLPGIENRVSGVLYYNQISIKLELLGILGESFKSFGEDKEFDIILGFSDKGEEFTLLNCYNSSFNFNAPGFLTETYSLNKFIVGGHFNCLEEISFDSLSVTPSYFIEWIKHPLFEFSLVEKKGFVSGVRNISFTEPKLFKEKVNCIESVIEETYKMDLLGDHSEKIEWQYYGGFKIKPNNIQNLSWFEDKMYKLRSLFTLFIGHSIYFKNIQFVSNDKVKINSKYFLYMIQDEEITRKTINSKDIVINFNDIKQNLGDILNSWFSKQELLKTVIDLYVGDFYIDKYINTRFLNFVQTLEIYHRHTGKGKVFDETEYNQFKEIVIQYVEDNYSAEYQKKITGLLIHGNEFSLGKRIKEIINCLDSETKKYLFGNSDNRNKFIQQIVETRNFLTHYDVNNKSTILNDDEQFYAIIRLKAIVTIILFKEIGVDEKLILNKIQGNGKYSYLLKAAKEILN